MKKATGIIVLIISIAAGLILILGSVGRVKYSDCIVDDETFRSITGERIENKEILEELLFEEESLFYDSESNVFYYSLIENNPAANDPHIQMRSSDKVEIAFLNEMITEENIKNDRAIEFVVYSDDCYCRYDLKCTTLPLMNISYSEEIGDVDVPMNIELFDNQSGTVNRVTVSKGKIRVRGATTTVFPKKGYRLSLMTDSAGKNSRPNDISLLGMRQDDDWLLYAAYNDQEKIRNVFSSNLWKYTCATDNAYHADTGMEYRYIELFMNGRYWGLYALGYPIDEKQLNFNDNKKENALYKKVYWDSEKTIRFKDGMEGYELKGTAQQTDRGVIDDSDWTLLYDYYYGLYQNWYDTEALYRGIDLNNAIDVYLFFNLIQGIDNVDGDLIKNQYLALKNWGGVNISALYCPWDMDQTWGNQWEDNTEANNIAIYSLPADYNCPMESGYLYQIMLNNDSNIWQSVFDKYRQLREGGWSEEYINALLDEYEDDIYGSGAYLRDMERWPYGTYSNPDEGLRVFREYVMERLSETDMYYQRLEGLCNESVFIQRSAQYKDFTDSRFIIELRNKQLLEDPDYKDLFEYLGIECEKITEDIQFILACPSEKSCEFLPSMEGADITGQDISMVFVKDQSVRTMDFSKNYTVSPVLETFRDLRLYIRTLSIMDCTALIEISNTDLWLDEEYRELFKRMGVSDLTSDTDVIFFNFRQNTGVALNGSLMSGNEIETDYGLLAVFEKEEGGYDIYLNNKQLSAGNTPDSKNGSVKITVFWEDSTNVADSAVWYFDMEDGLGMPKVLLRECIRPG